MRTAILDAWSGVAGDMWVGAMLDAGAPFEPLVEAVASLQLPGVAIRQQVVMRASLRGVKFDVDVGRAPEPGKFTMLSPQSHSGVQLQQDEELLLRGGHRVRAPEAHVLLRVLAQRRLLAVPRRVTFVRVLRASHLENVRMTQAS